MQSNFDIICRMEYQSFFLVLKDYQLVNGKFCSINPIGAKGFVLINKELDKYYLTIEACGNHEEFFVVDGNSVQSGNLGKKSTKIELKFVPNISEIVVLIPQLLLFATKTGTEACEKALEQIEKKESKNLFQKVFGEVYDTYFFDMVKPKLSRLFELGTETNDFSFIGGKWTRLYACGEEKVFGIIYKNKFAYAIAVGEVHNSQKPVANLIKAGNKLYNIVFMSASDGKYLQV